VPQADILHCAETRSMSAHSDFETELGLARARQPPCGSCRCLHYLIDREACWLLARHGLFKWLAGRDVIDTNPMVSIPRPKLGETRGLPVSGQSKIQKAGCP
jgi:hypothetical protein